MDRSFQFQSLVVDQRFLFAAAAALLTASLVASLASPSACWPLPLTSWIAPSPCRRPEPGASPTPLLALPMASLAAPLTLSAVLPIGTLLQVIKFGGTSPGRVKCSSAVWFVTPDFCSF